MKELVKLRVTASFTVEGAFVFPIVVMLIFSLISLTFHLHNDVKEQADELHLSEYRRALIYADIPEESLDEMLESYRHNVLGKGYLYEPQRDIQLRDSVLSFARREDIKRTAYVGEKLVRGSRKVRKEG